MDLGIKGKVAIIGGASKGLGKAVAEGLAAEGCNLALCARGAQALEDTAREISQTYGVKVMAEPVDLSQPGQAFAFAQKALKELGSLDIVVNNAGGPPAGVFADFDEQAWRGAVDLTLLPALAWARAALPGMQQNKWGRIINICSMSVRHPLPGLILSNSIRAAVVGWAKTLADEAGRDLITVNNVCPGWTRTQRMDSLIGRNAENKGISKEAAVDEVTVNIPLGRLAEPKEFADMVVFLASERAAYVTGETILVDGGFSRALM